jgi:hypothetical protein
VKTLLDYDAATGIFTWRVSRQRAKQGAPAGCIEKRIGYHSIGIDNKVYKTHRLAWLYMTGEWPTSEIDHINHIRSDNSFSNLRVVSSAQNHQNRARKTNSASGYLGVTWHKRALKWYAHIEVNGKSHHLGCFKDLTEAINARQKAELLYHPHRPKDY